MLSRIDPSDLVGDSLDETGAANVREGQEQVVARLDASSRVRRGEKAELWVDTSRLHLFDPRAAPISPGKATARAETAIFNPQMKIGGFAG